MSGRSHGTTFGDERRRRKRRIGMKEKRLPKRKQTKRCKSVSPLSGLRCALDAGHKGQHRADAYELKKYIDEVVADTFQ